MHSDNDIYLASRSLTKYDSSGNLLWQATLPLTTLLSDVVGPDGTIYVAGEGYDPNNIGISPSGFIAAYDPSGNQLWSKLILPTGETWFRIEGLTISQNSLVASGWYADGAGISGNEFVALAIPEPNTFAFLTIASFLLMRNRKLKKHPE